MESATVSAAGSAEAAQPKNIDGKGDIGAGASSASPGEGRSVSRILVELAVAEGRLGAWKHALSLYSGSDPELYRAEIRKASDAVTQLKLELRAAHQA